MNQSFKRFLSFLAIAGTGCYWLLLIGISKLYKSKGINEDGSVTQKCFTESINQKVGAELNDEILVLTKDN